MFWMLGDERRTQKEIFDELALAKENKKQEHKNFCMTYMDVFLGLFKKICATSQDRKIF